MGMVNHPPAEDLDSCRVKRKRRNKRRRKGTNETVSMAQTPNHAQPTTSDTGWEVANASKTLEQINADFYKELQESESEACTVAAITDDENAVIGDSDAEIDKKWKGANIEWSWV